MVRKIPTKDSFCWTSSMKEKLCSMKFSAVASWVLTSETTKERKNSTFGGFDNVCFIVIHFRCLGRIADHSLTGVSELLLRFNRCFRLVRIIWKCANPFRSFCQEKVFFSGAKVDSVLWRIFSWKSTCKIVHEVQVQNSSSSKWSKLNKYSFLTFSF